MLKKIKKKAKNTNIFFFTKTQDLLLLLITLLLFLLLQEVWKALPPLLKGPVGQVLGCLHTGLASSSPQVPKY